MNKENEQNENKGEYNQNDKNKIENKLNETKPNQNKLNENKIDPYINSNKRIVLIRTFDHANKELLDYPIYTLAGERDEWENILEQDEWSVQDETGKVYKINPKQVAVTEFWLQETAKLNYYNKTDKLPITTSLPRYFDNKSFTQGVLHDYNLTMPNVSVKYMPIVNKIKQSKDEIVPVLSINKVLNNSPLSQILYAVKSTVNDTNLVELKDKIKTKMYEYDEIPIEDKNIKKTDQYIQFIFRNHKKTKATYLKPSVHTGCGMGVVRIGIENDNFYIETSEPEFMKILIQNEGETSKDNNQRVFFIPYENQNMESLIEKTLKKTYFPYFYKKLGGETNYIFEEEFKNSVVEHKIEFRFVVQNKDNKFISYANYAKVGATDFVANLSLSGKGADTKEVLNKLIEKTWPFLTTKQKQTIIRTEISEMKKAAIKVFETILRKAKQENRKNKGKENYLVPSTMNLCFGSVDFTPIIDKNIGIMCKAVEVNTGTIGIKALQELDKPNYYKVVKLWNGNLIKACKKAFTK